MSDTKNAIVDASAPVATSKSASWANWVVGVQGPLLGLILLCVIFTFTTNVFFSVRNALNILDQVTVLGILAVGMTLVIVIGGIDLSVGSILALVMMVMGWAKETFDVPLPLAILVALLCGAVCGLLNGLLVTKAKLPAFIATLAMMSIGRGLANIVTDGRQIVGFPDWFTSLSTIRHFGFIATDSVSAARTLGEYVGKITDGKGKVGILQGQLGTTPELDRDKGFNEALSKFPGLQAVAKQPSKAWMQDEGFSIAQDMLQRHPDITVFFGRADALALGAAQAVKVGNLDHKVIVVGFDGDVAGLKAVRDGTLTATMTQQTQGMGRLALQSALDLIDGKKLPADQLQEAVLTTKENVGPFVEKHP